MITPRDVQPIVATTEFQRVLKLAEQEPGTRAYRALKGLERFARGITGREDRWDHYVKSGHGKTHKAPGSAPRRSLKETVDGTTEHLSV